MLPGQTRYSWNPGFSGKPGISPYAPARDGRREVFVRIPACYTLWIEEEDVYRISETMLEKLDRIVRFGQKYGIHVCLNFHRAPGYSVNPERKEPFNLWKDEQALQAFCYHMKTGTAICSTGGCWICWWSFDPDSPDSGMIWEIRSGVNRSHDS